MVKIIVSVILGDLYGERVVHCSECGRVHSTRYEVIAFDIAADHFAWHTSKRMEDEEISEQVAP